MRAYRPLELTIIDTSYEEYKSIVQYLRNSGQISLAADAENSLRKALLLSCASFWEVKIQDVVENLADSRSNSDLKITSLVKIKVISRQYHTWFDWKSGNAGGFFAMFGEDYKLEATKQLKTDVDFKKCLAAFMEIGSLRNLLVHNNFAIFPIQKTLDEIYELYLDGMGFIDYCSVTLR